ncbi:hypothetical protein ND861_09580 [Leptospira sp. 2 VSF19]|uniref:Uncharacterized protein n=1 Tax=Leptospira soteropolitanensis TaxID=2950025 RepID=A0AAW5VGX3_9LEPT|nr:hypothetical protein [Leptospira soteropolitanensis]MCW7492544.1 hypothetical protein [Leptospira soteropolitanensis]MCW7500592.1 hypothetical protein [Leptospira soteropolitanensis]MCW7522738.1 hypothetical protein [Leptospira soteropolitanensis]MCW7526594.1 hypothetical protein [Leptospira soteropolitanensis]MCW7530562.1 hypothetical protein [Leptospira soteropolitanensis]
MPIWIRKTNKEKTENYHHLMKDDWDLTNNFEAFSDWIQSVDGTLDKKFDWVADISFSPRPNATGGGPVISFDLMKLCIKNNIEIYISEFNS